MTTKSSLLPRLSLNRGETPSILPLHNSRYTSLRSRSSEYDLDNLSPRAEEGFMSPEFHDPNLPSTSTVNMNHGPTKSSNRKPTGALNRRPSNSSSSTGSASKTRPILHGDRIIFDGPPPPIAVSRFLYRDEEQRAGYNKYEDDREDGSRDGDGGIAASWLPGTARRAISSVMWDRGQPQSGQDLGEKPVSFDRNSVWRGLARRERAIVAELQRFLQVQEDSLNRGGNSSAGYDDTASVSDTGSATPTGTATPSITSSRHPGRSVSFLEPVTRAGPGGEVIPVRQPRAKKLGISGARKGIARSMADLANLKAEEDASLTSALSARKKALAKLRKLATRRDGISDELQALEGDEEEPLRLELEELGDEHRGVCTEIQELEERLSKLKGGRRLLEVRMDDVRNRREAGLSGYKNALKEVEDAVKAYLTLPPVKPLDTEALTENLKGEELPASPGGVEFMHLRPERRTVEMARQWWEAEVGVLEKRKAAVDMERAALEEGGDFWEEVVNVVLDFEADLRKQMSRRDRSPLDGVKGKDRELSAAEILKLQYEKISGVIADLEQRLAAAEKRGWNLLIAAVGAELEAFKEAASVNREMLKAAGIEVDVLSSSSPADVFREDSGTTGSHRSFHTVNGGSMLAEQPGEVPSEANEDNIGETVATADGGESDNEVPADLLAVHEDQHIGDEQIQEGHDEEQRNTGGAAPGAALLDREDSENEVPAEFLVEHREGAD